MKIGINVDTVRLNGSFQNLEEELKTFSSMGFDCAEIPPAGMSLIFDSNLKNESLNKLVEITSRFDLEYTIHAPDPVNLATPRKEDLQIIFNVIEIASAINASVIVYHCGYKKGEMTSFKNEVQSLKIAATKLKGTVLALENTHQMVDEVLEVVEAVSDEKIRLLIDLGHLYLRCNGDRFKFLEQIELGVEKAVEIHVHDNFGKKAEDLDEKITQNLHFAYLYGVGDLHLPLGFGTIPYEEVFTVLRRSFDGFVVLEINDLNRFKVNIPSSLSLLREKLCLSKNS